MELQVQASLLIDDVGCTLHHLKEVISSNDLQWRVYVMKHKTPHSATLNDKFTHSRW